MIRLVFVLLLTASAALAQVATLTGRITDQTGAVVPQASVTARATDTGLTTTTETTSEGFLSRSPALPPGHYELNVTKQGFVPVKQTGLELTVQQVVRLDITLKVGALTETVEVRPKPRSLTARALQSARLSATARSANSRCWAATPMRSPCSSLGFDPLRA